MTLPCSPNYRCQYNVWLGFAGPSLSGFGGGLPVPVQLRLLLSSCIQLAASWQRPTVVLRWPPPIKAAHTVTAHRSVRSMHDVRGSIVSCALPSQVS